MSVRLFVVDRARACTGDSQGKATLTLAVRGSILITRITHVLAPLGPSDRWRRFETGPGYGLMFLAS